MTTFSDILYGKIEVPDWLIPFLKIPEFVRLRGVRLSNVDSYEFKDFSAPTRWEHSVAVAALALRCANKKGLNIEETVTLTLAALLHDVATPPFAHTVEYVLENFDHEIETQQLLSQGMSDNTAISVPVFLSALPRFHHECKALSKTLKIKIDPYKVGQLVLGEGYLGFLVSGTLDLDNADNVIRGCHYLGIEVDKSLPLRLADWLASLDSTPLNLEKVAEESVKEWLSHRSQYYGKFFNSSNEEIGRQAFLQHLMRRAYNSGLPRRMLVCNTDSNLLNDIRNINDKPKKGWDSLSGLVERYQLLEATSLVIEIDIFQDEYFRYLKHPLAADWIEQELSSDFLEVFIIMSSRRGGENKESLLPRPVGRMSVYKLGESLSYKQLPSWLQDKIPPSYKGNKLKQKLAEVVNSQLDNWSEKKPWFEITKKRDDRIIENLKSIGDWSFRLSRNRAIHAYPGTFVHAIPATLINVLGIKGEKILDTFGGTGQTAVEVVKSGGTAISADSNYIATLAAEAKLSFLNHDNRQYLKSIEESMLSKFDSVKIPSFQNINKWHHKETQLQLAKIREFIALQNDSITPFLLTAFSAILPSSTARKGKEHGWFADNTPLQKGQEEPPFQDAFKLFTNRIKYNLNVIEKLYSEIEITGNDIEEALSKTSVIRASAAINKEYEEAGVENNSIRAIITSPPYLCMADYTLGQRLSYYWLNPSELKIDFEREIGPRRKRNSPHKAAESYFKMMDDFFNNASELLMDNGYLAMVLGEPSAKSFQDSNIFDRLSSSLSDKGFERVWSTWRPIHWHRNQGYQRLKKEKIAVYKKHL